MGIITDIRTTYNIPFSPPYIDEDVIAEVTDTLKSGWITTGPKVKQLELLCKKFTGAKKAVCVNSWTSGAGLVFRWLGIGPGDEVIIPAYTYAATALSVLNAGATPVMVDVLKDFTIDPQKIKQAITSRTKAIIAVDVAGWPCDYDSIRAVVSADDVVKQFKPATDIQEQFGRPIVLSDAAHSLGAIYNGFAAALAADITVFSLHAVKNVTTAEGGVICLNLPEPFDNEEVYQWMKLNSLNGQTKDAFSKARSGEWRYDIVSQGMKINMPDICAAVGLAQLRKYPGLLLPRRKDAYDRYISFLYEKDWAIIPICADEKRVSSFHLFPLRIKDITEQQRDRIIAILAEKTIAVNVHFIPLPMFTLFKKMGYKMEDYPVAYANYANEISLPLYPQLSFEQISYIAKNLEEAYHQVK